MKAIKNALTEISVEEQRAALPICVLPTCTIFAFAEIEQLYITGEYVVMPLCMGHALQYRSMK